MTKLTLTQSKIHTVSIDDESLGDFKVSEIDGVYRMVNIETNEVIVAVAEGVSNIFANIFGEGETDVDLIKASPDLLCKIKKIEKNTPVDAKREPARPTTRTGNEFR